ncbi:hypothetical protein [Streptomyces sp. NPDC055189]
MAGGLLEGVVDGGRTMATAVQADIDAHDEEGLQTAGDVAVAHHCHRADGVRDDRQRQSAVDADHGRLAYPCCHRHLRTGPAGMLCGRDPRRCSP